MKKAHAKALWQHLKKGYNAKTAAASAAITCSPALSIFAESNQYIRNDYQNNWPWMKFLGSLAGQLTGPIPLVLGVMGIVGAAVALFSGNHGGGTTKFIVLIFAISICLFAPSFMNMISDSASSSAMDGLTIFP